MKKFNYIFLALLISSCATYRPDSSGITELDYNGRMYVDNPHYNKRTNAVGYAGIALATAAGGYAAYNYDDGLIHYTKDGEKQDMKIADAAIGALVGFTVSYFMHKIFSEPKKIKSDIIPQDWLQDVEVDNQYNLLGFDDRRLQIIDKKYESQYVVNNFDDVKDFETAFPNSQYLDEMLKNAVGNVKREELYQLIVKYPDSKYSKEMQVALLDTSPTLEEFFESDKNNPNSGYNTRQNKIKELASKTERGTLATITTKYGADRDIDLVKYQYFITAPTLEDLYAAKEEYKGYEFPEFDSKAQSLIQTAQRETLFSIIAKNPKDKFINEYKTEYINKSKNLEELLNAKDAYPEIEFDYDTKALSLVNDANEMPTFIRIVKNSRTIQRGMEKVDNLMWERAKANNSRADYENYINNAPLKNYRTQAQSALQNLPESIDNN